jgi:hypothetical protein
LSITSSTSVLIPSIDRDTFTSLTIDNTSVIISTASENSLTVSSTIESTGLDHIFITDLEIATTIFSNVDTTFIKIVNNSTSLQKVPNASKITSTALKVPTNKSGTLKKSSKKSYLSATTPLSRNPAPPKKSSFRNILLLFVLIFCGIGLILFFIFRYRKNRENDDISLLNRNDSDESYNSVTIESEINPSQDEQSHIDRTRKGGRMFSQLDPDAL